MKLFNRKQMLYFSTTMVASFKRTNTSLRYGQEFHQFFSLEKVTGEDKIFCDKLYQADEEEARKMIASRIDYSQ